MRLTRDDIYNQWLRNIDQAGNTTDANLNASFNLYLGTRYQLILSKMRDFRTQVSTNFLTGMNVTLLSTGVSQPIASITGSGTTATVTTASAHGYSTGNSVAISGAAQALYNGTYTITVSSTTVFTYTLSSSAVVTTATSAQYYPYPLGEVSIDGMFITVGSVNYPLQVITSLLDWEQLNAILIQASALPQFYFPRRDDFGIWPIPQTTYTGTIAYHYRDRNLLVADYSSGTVALTQGSTTVVGTNTTFTSAMVGRWFSVTDTTIPGQGYWLRVSGFTDATHLTLSQPWVQATVSGATYRIGESPEIPEEGHLLLLAGVTADYYTYLRKDTSNATPYENIFYTGDPSNATRKEGDTTVAGGLIGLVNRYADRDDTRIVKRKPHLNPLQTKVWATSLS